MDLQSHNRIAPRHATTATGWRPLLRRALGSGTVAAIASGFTVALLARRRTGHLASGPNATSHVLWGESAGRCHQVDVRHTATGVAIHHASAVFWATGFEWLLARRHPPHPVVAAAAVATTAYMVDYHLVPKRLTPGFELHLSAGEVRGAFAAIAAGLAVTAMLRAPRRG